MDGSSKIDARPKPILSPTRSLDEGFESDPERASSSTASDTEQSATTVKKLSPSKRPSFDVLQRTDRDGVQHTQISRRQFMSTEHLSGPASIICLQGEVEKELNRNSDHKVSIPRAGIPAVPPPQQQHHERFRADNRNKIVSTTLPRNTGGRRSHSVEPIVRRNEVAAASVPFVKYGRQNNAVAKQSSLPLAQQPTMPNSMFCQANSLYTFYPAEGNISLYASHYGLTYKSSHMNVQSKAPISWTQSVPRHTRR